MSIASLSRTREHELPEEDVLVADDETSTQETPPESLDTEESAETEQAAATIERLQQHRSAALQNVCDIVQTPYGPRAKYPYPFGYKNVEYGETD